MVGTGEHWENVALARGGGVKFRTGGKDGGGGLSTVPDFAADGRKEPKKGGDGIEYESTVECVRNVFLVFST